MKRIGLIAGAGDFPILIANAARSNGVEVLAIGLSGFASQDLEQAANSVIWVELGQVSRIIRTLHEHQIDSIMMAGRVPHSSIFQYRHFDARALKVLARAINKKADALLGAVTAELESDGIQVLDSAMFLQSLMPEPGLLTINLPLSPEEAEDIDFGYPIAKVIAGQDIGQTIVVKDKAVIAVEGLEGTDECIKRASELAGAGCVVVKVSKPAQDRRFDIPVVGKGTIEVMRDAQCRALAVSAGESLLFDRELVIQMAEKAGISILAR